MPKILWYDIAYCIPLWVVTKTPECLWQSLFGVYSSFHTSKCSSCVSPKELETLFGISIACLSFLSIFLCVGENTAELSSFSVTFTILRYMCVYSPFLLDVSLFPPLLPDLQGPRLVIPIHGPPAELWIPIPRMCHPPVPRGHGSPGPGGPLQRPSAIHLSEDWTTGQHQQGHCANHKDTMVTERPSVCCCHPCTFRYLFHSDCCYHSVLRHKVKKRVLFYNAAHYILLSHHLKVILFSCFYKTRHLAPALGLMQTFSATLKCLLVGIGWHVIKMQATEI